MTPYIVVGSIMGVLAGAAAGLGVNPLLSVGVAAVLSGLIGSATYHSLHGGVGGVVVGAARMTQQDDAESE